MAQVKSSKAKKKQSGSKRKRSGLALKRGPKAVTGTPPPWPVIDETVVRAVSKALETEPLSALRDGTPGAFEKRFAKYHHRRYALMTNSGTAALQLALAGCGLEPGDEVITTPYTWGGTIGAILHHNAVPVFADIDPETLCLDPEAIRGRISKRTRAILPVHIFGMPADMATIVSIAREHGLKVVEDCSQAAGAQYRSKLVGRWGDVGAFSLQASKNLTAGEGGILITSDREIYDRALALGTHPVRIEDEVYHSQYKRYADGLNFNFRPHPLAAAIAGAQLSKLAGWVREKNRNFRRLFDRVEGIVEPHGAAFRREHKGLVHGYHRVSLKFVHPDLAGLPHSVLLKALRAEGMDVGGYVETPVPLRRRFRDLRFYGRGCPWTCRHALRLPDYSPGNWPVAEALCSDGEIILQGNHYEYDEALMDQYATAFEKLAKYADKLKTYAARYAKG
ncbi:MAG: DegT/DnrJ/EryC1/StrS family aminotransferase [Planctomycetota bacterium]